MTKNSRKLLNGEGISRQLAQAVRKRDDYTCAACQTKSVNKTELEMTVHHITYVSENVIEARNPENLITMCEHCHKKFHAEFDNKPAERNQFNKMLKALAKSRMPKFKAHSDHVDRFNGKATNPFAALAELR